MELNSHGEGITFAEGSKEKVLTETLAASSERAGARAAWEAALREAERLTCMVRRDVWSAFQFSGTGCPQASSYPCILNTLEWSSQDTNMIIILSITHPITHYKEIKIKSLQTQTKAMYSQSKISTCDSVTITPLGPTMFFMLSSPQHSLYQHKTCAFSVVPPHFLFSSRLLPYGIFSNLQHLSCRSWKQQTSIYGHVKWATVYKELGGRAWLQRWPKYLKKEWTNEQ